MMSSDWRFGRPHERVQRWRLNENGSRRQRCRGDGLSGRGQVEQRTDGSSHLGEPSLLQDMKRKTQLTLHRQDTTEEESHKGRGQHKRGGDNRKVGQQMAN